MEGLAIARGRRVVRPVRRDRTFVRPVRRSFGGQMRETCIQDPGMGRGRFMSGDV
jgi:hypothetical protein